MGGNQQRSKEVSRGAGQGGRKGRKSPAQRMKRDEGVLVALGKPLKGDHS